MESSKRTIIKAVLWNVLGLFTMSLVGYLATGSASLGGVVALANTLIGFILYVLYERLWAQIGWGRRD